MPVARADGVLDSTCMGSSTSASHLSTGQARDDGGEDGNDALRRVSVGREWTLADNVSSTYVDYGFADGSNRIDDGHDAGADCGEHALNL